MGKGKDKRLKYGQQQEEPNEESLPVSPDSKLNLPVSPGSQQNLPVSPGSQLNQSMDKLGLSSSPKKPDKPFLPYAPGRNGNQSNTLNTPGRGCSPRKGGKGGLNK